MFPRWVQPSALGTPDRVRRLEEPSFREPTRGVPGECVQCGFCFFGEGGCVKCIFEEALFSCDEETCLLLSKEVAGSFRRAVSGPFTVQWYASRPSHA